jgi:adenylate cyclase
VDATDFEAAGLYDPNAPSAADRLALLEFLAGRGATLDELVDTLRAGDFASLLREHVVRGPGPRLTPREVAARLGTTPEVVARTWRAGGFAEVPADTPFFSLRDEAVFAGFLLGVAMFGEESTLQFTRVVGSSMARIADAAVSLFLVSRQAPLTEAGASVDAVRRAAGEATLTLVDDVPAVMAGLFRHHVNAALRRSLLVRENVALVRLAVGFVDLVGYTDLSRQLPASDLAAAVTDFERIASDLVAERNERIVKLIGDEVMYVTVDPATACELALELCDRVAAHPVLGAARGAVAEGTLLARDGDYYGEVVNVAARALPLAEPGGVLSTEPVRQSASEAGTRLGFTSIGAHRLRGFDAPVELFAVRRR